MTIDDLIRAAPPGTRIPKPQAGEIFSVKGTGKRRGESALVYSIPSRAGGRPHEKGITATEFTAAQQQLAATGYFTKRWFDEHLTDCAMEGSCNFTTIGGLFEHLGIARYAARGAYERVTVGEGDA